MIVKKNKMKNNKKIIYNRIYRKTHKKQCQIYAKKYRATHKKDYYNYYLKNKEKIIKTKHKWYLKNKLKLNEYSRKNYIKNKKRIMIQTKKYIRLKRTTDINFRLRDILRHRIYLVLKLNQKSKSTIKLLGCSIDFLKHHLEKQFTKGMSWSNYGSGWYGKGKEQWHIDHIRPCARFDLTKKSEQLKCFNWRNLQPLWAKDNLSKHNKERKNKEIK